MKLDYDCHDALAFRAWGPYLMFGRSAATEMTVAWRSKFYSTEGWLEYWISETEPTRVTQPGDPAAVFYAFPLTGLQPNTTYSYRISRPEDLQRTPHPVYHFTTGPPDGTPATVDFCVFADLHAQEDRASRAFASIARNSPDAGFVLSAGDAITHGGKEETWNDYFFQSAPYLPSLPVMHATGNHDTDHPETYAHFLATFRYPYVDTTIGAFYSFVYGNVAFVMLDSDNAGQSVAMQGVVSDEQLEWLEETLAAYRAKDYWIFVCTHHQIYSTGDTGMMLLYELAYRDLFDEYHVDAVFYGHDHLFEVFWVGRDQPWGGTHYCLVGNAGSDLNEMCRDPLASPPPNYLWTKRTYAFEQDGLLGGNPNGARNDALVQESHVYSALERGVTHIRLEGDRCTLRMIGLHNEVYFEDTFGKTGPGKRYSPPTSRLN